MAQNLSTNTGLGATPEFQQSKNPEIWADLLRVRNAISVLQSALDTYTGALSEDPAYMSQISPTTSVRTQNISRLYAQATEAITIGSTVNFYNNAGTLGVRNANATNNTKPAHAYALKAVASGDYGEFILGGILATFTGMTPGTRYFLGLTNGSYTATAPSTAGNIIQPVGFVITPTTFMFNPTLNWTQL